MVARLTRAKFERARERREDRRWRALMEVRWGNSTQDYTEEMVDDQIKRGIARHHQKVARLLERLEGKADS